MASPFTTNPSELERLEAFERAGMLSDKGAERLGALRSDVSELERLKGLAADGKITEADAEKLEKLMRSVSTRQGGAAETVGARVLAGRTLKVARHAAASSALAAQAAKGAVEGEGAESVVGGMAAGGAQAAGMVGAAATRNMVAGVAAGAHAYGAARKGVATSLDASRRVGADVAEKLVGTDSLLARGGRSAKVAGSYAAGYAGRAARSSAGDEASASSSEVTGLGAQLAGSYGRGAARRGAKAGSAAAAAGRRATLKGVSYAASKASAAAAAKGLAMPGGIAGRAGRLAGRGLIRAAAALGGALAGLLVMVALLSALLVVPMAVLGGAASSHRGVGSLTGTAREVASALLSYGFTPEATAAVLGNIQQESSMTAATDGDDGYGTMSCGMLQMTGGERAAFLSWASQNGKEWSSAAVQIEWTFSGEDGTSEGYYANRWGTGLAPHYYELERGFESRFGTDFYTDAAAFKDSTDLDLAVYSWMACYERPGSAKSPQYGGDDVSRLNNRLAYAREFYEQMATGSDGSAEYSASTAEQQAIVDACRSVGSPGGGLCAMWVSQVYYTAGLGYPGGNADDMYYQYCWSSDKDDLKVGMIVAVPAHSHTSAGSIYGHVAIYIGGGQVMDNIGHIRTCDLDYWIDYYSTDYTPKWGFAADL